MKDFDKESKKPPEHAGFRLSRETELRVKRLTDALEGKTLNRQERRRRRFRRP